MANKIIFNGTLTLQRGSGNVSLKGAFTANQTGTNFTSETQTIGLTAEAIDFGPDIGTIGYLLIRNNDAANFVEIATDSDMTKNVAVIRAGEAVPVLPKAGATLYGKADTAPVQIEFLAIQI